MKINRAAKSGASVAELGARAAGGNVVGKGAGNEFEPCVLGFDCSAQSGSGGGGRAAGTLRRGAGTCRAAIAQSEIADAKGGVGDFEQAVLGCWIDGNRHVATGAIEFGFGFDDQRRGEFDDAITREGDAPSGGRGGPQIGFVADGDDRSSEGGKAAQQSGHDPH